MVQLKSFGQNLASEYIVVPPISIAGGTERSETRVTVVKTFPGKIQKKLKLNPGSKPFSLILLGERLSIFQSPIFVLPLKYHF